MCFIHPRKQVCQDSAHSKKTDHYGIYGFIHNRKQNWVILFYKNRSVWRFIDQCGVLGFNAWTLEYRLVRRFSFLHPSKRINVRHRFICSMQVSVHIIENRAVWHFRFMCIQENRAVWRFLFPLSHRNFGLASLPKDKFECTGPRWIPQGWSWRAPGPQD